MPSHTINLVAAALGLIAATQTRAQTPSETVVYSFPAGANSLSTPNAGLVNVAGTLFGTAGDNVFSLKPDGKITKIATIDGEVDTDLVDKDGVLFGVTYNGGTYGKGSVFSVTPTGSEKTIYSFTGGVDGSEPYGPLMRFGKQLYGTTISGGADDVGNVFTISPTDDERVVYSFTSGPGGTAGGSVGLTNIDGTFYGTTQSGGSSLVGTMYSLTRKGVFTVLYTFTGSSAGPSSDGSSPSSLVALNGVLYGTTYGGGAYGHGTVFSITTTGAEKIIYSFTGGSDGNYPFSGLTVLNGVLYGTTVYGGTHEQGTVFSITPSGAETTLHSFGGNGDGINPDRPLVKFHGSLFGTTTYGGAYSAGAIYRITP